jgi:hypothetical protein
MILSTLRVRSLPFGKPQALFRTGSNVISG